MWLVVIIVVVILIASEINANRGEKEYQKILEEVREKRRKDEERYQENIRKEEERRQGITRT